jgi:indole-3-glycerol phosphate synthase
MSPTFLEKIVEKTRSKIDVIKHDVDIDELRERACGVRQTIHGGRFRNALGQKGRPNIIAEIKRASPSKGAISDSVDIKKLALDYEAGGAAAISVLTEREYFGGSLDDLRTVRAAVGLPILRKDFIVDEYQIYEAADAGADAVLLIVAALGENRLTDLLRLVRELNLDALVEVHTPDEMKVAAAAGAELIGINNRDLHSLEVSLDVSRKLIGHRPAGALMITESGLSNRIEIDELKDLGFDGFLIGETLMRADSARETLGGWI